MNRKFFLLLSCWFLTANTVHADVPSFQDDSEPVRYGFLTHPRSGTKWFKYCLIYGANRFFLSGNNLWHNYGEEIDYSKPLITWSHNPKSFLRFQPKRDKLILLIRNYRECIIRRFGAKKINRIIREINEGGYNGHNSPNCYFEILSFFDQWPEENRLLIYYEDFMKKPKEILANALAFIGDDPAILEEFFENFDEHKAKSLAWRNSRSAHLRPVSNGKDLTYHTRRISKKNAKLFDNAVKERYPDLWKRYLTRYEWGK